MNSLYRRILQTSSRNRLLSPLSHFSTKTKPQPKPPNTANSDPPPRLWSPFSPKPKPNPEWARPTEIPFQAKVSNSVQLIGYVQAPVQFQTAAEGSSWAATVLSHQLASDADSESPDSLPLW